MIRRMLLGAALAAFALPALAQPRAPGTDYPNRPVRVIVAFAAGGNADMNARIISGALSTRLGQQFVVENRPSGGGTVAFETVAQTAPDGYTLLVGALGSHTLNVGLYGERLRVHPLTGVDHITISSHSPIVLVAHPSMNVRTLAEFRAALAAGNGQVPYGSSGNGSTGHIASALLLHLLGVQATHVPYRGSAAAFQDLLGARTMFQSDTISFVAEHIREGRVVGLAIGTPERSPMAPNVPTAAEAGLPAWQATTWTPWSATLGTPLPIRQFLYEQISEVLKTPEVRDRIIALGNTIPENMTPEATRAFIASEIERWVPIVRASGARVD
ncbi:tripartite tricarboxylate transporter substrate binding protein [Roseomonas alkaliterrae]|uniref:Tripartite-type tricarboxylate transporter receptor subunit TctC n=1 Tax=Neoroseomonas alkaliterrae TaxID=1452450 RepID=A0A840Y7B3_9PROT|nr:tripartite tricarboxylate transporter substrate binding protein [Neoroseomonas alkaliterrae]MBB5689774.1 tripartite-type tricarboxylate transporter receptor subunit TctC [Neoroseomonas alkaliterrae]MBR0674918.1 tripartite tricarboxylate transporter substrate binding protein [Neoroseomonas alkaliterrae]